MAGSLGKRKRDKHQKESNEGGDDEGALRSLFQRAFEAKFRPLETSLPIAQPIAEQEGEVDDSEDDEDEAETSDWDGISEDEQQAPIEVHHHATSRNVTAEVQKGARKAFMTSKPPSSTPRPQSLPKRGATVPEDDPAEATNLKHDLALQRLLKESHLLDANSFTTDAPQISGKSRLKALDLRLKDLGAKKSSMEQQKMPLAHRRGITTKAADREERRRKDARENGIILEKVKNLAKGNQPRRVRSVGGPAVGKFNGGTLRLGARDLRSIQGPTKGRKRR